MFSLFTYNAIVNMTVLFYNLCIYNLVFSSVFFPYYFSFPAYCDLVECFLVFHLTFSFAILAICILYKFSTCPQKLISYKLIRGANVQILSKCSKLRRVISHLKSHCSFAIDDKYFAHSYIIKSNIKYV